MEDQQQKLTHIIGADGEGKCHIVKSRTGNHEMPYGMEDFINALDDVTLGVLHHLAQRRITEKEATKCPSGSSSPSPSLSLTPG